MTTGRKCGGALAIALSAVLIATLAGGCRGTGYITLDINTNAVCADVGGTAVTVGVLGQIESRPPVASTAQCAANGEIGTLTIVPSASEDDEVAIKVTLGFHQPGDACTPPDYRGCIVARRVARFVPGRETRLDIPLDIACKDVPCGELETCSHGECVPVACAGDEGCDAGRSRDAGSADGVADATVEPPETSDLDATPVDASVDRSVTDGADDAVADAASDAVVDAVADANDGSLDANDASASVFSYRRPITIDHTKVGLVGAPVTLSSFPVLVSLTDPALRTVASGGHVVSPSGVDLQFKIVGDAVACGGLPDCDLDFEIERYDGATGTLLAWVRLPAVRSRTSATDTRFYLYYGSATVTASLQNAPGVWSSGYSGVWHLAESPAGTAPQARDSSANANHGTTGGAMLANQQVAGIAGGALLLDGKNDYVSVPDSASLQYGANVDFTFGAWVKSVQVPVSMQWPAIINKENRLALPRTGINLVLHTSNLNAAWYPEVWVAGTQYPANANDVADGTWHCLVGVRVGANVLAYQDGVLVATVPASSGSTIRAGTPLVFGAALSAIPFSYFDGRIDEVRLSDVARSADWLAAEYASIAQPSTFAVLGAEEPL